MVAEETGWPVDRIYREMPLRLVHAYEHRYYEKQGFHCYPKSWKTSLVELAKSF